MTAPVSGSPPPGPDAEPLLSQRTVLVLLTAAFIGVVVGVLALFSTGNAAGALLTGLFGSGASTLGLHKLIGYHR